MKDKPFALIGINSDDDLEAIRRVVKEKEINWRSFQNKSAVEAIPISSNWAVSGWPTLVVIDSNFTIRYRGHDGDEATAVAKDLIAKLITEKKLQPQPPNSPEDPAIQEF